MPKELFPLPGGIVFDQPGELRQEAAFHLLWSAHFPKLRHWNNAHVFDPFWRIYHNARPGNFIRHEGRRIDLKPSVFVIVPAHVLFETFAAPRPMDHLFVHFTVEPGLFFRADAPVVLPVSAVGRDLARELRRGFTIGDRDRMRHLLLAWLHYVFVRFPSASALPRPEIVRALKTLEDVRSQPSLPEMARGAGMSRRHFHRAFEQALGKSPTRYVRESRLRQAARQLAGSSGSIEEIAENLGFANRFHFSRLFREFVGQSPAAFRREAKTRSKTA